MKTSEQQAKDKPENAGESVFCRTDPALSGVLTELKELEPLFHTEAFGISQADFKARMAEEYWEVGASGRRYSRAFILRHFEEQAPVLAKDAGWRLWDHALRQLGPAVYLFTYVLAQGDRRTRRASVWERDATGWRVLYHQGTVMTGVDDDVMPA